MSDVRVLITGLVGLFTDPACVSEPVDGGPARQEFVVCFHGMAMGGTPRPDLHEATAAVWCDPRELTVLPVDHGALAPIQRALLAVSEPYLG